MQNLFAPSKWSTPQKLSFSFGFVIFIGSLLLSLPIAQKPGVHLPYLDHLFTSTSMVCVTGLSVLTLQDTYNLFGQTIAILLMQIGGLGLITIIAASLYYLNKRISLKDQYLLQEALNRKTSEDFITFLFSIYRFTFTVELIAALVLMIDFIPRFGVGYGIFNSFFIAISAFCNAGFDNLGSSSLQQFVTNPLVNFTVIFLIVLGGIGFSVWFELKDLIHKFKEQRVKRLRLVTKQMTIHTRLVLYTTATLLVMGTVIMWLAESNNPNTIGELSFGQKWMTSFFQTVTMRTAGFSTIDFELTRPFTNLIYMLQMFIGGAPGGTAGGVKITTAAILFLLFRSELKGYKEVHFHRRIFSSGLVKQALTIVLFFFLLLVVGFALLLLSQPHLDPFALLFETVSALGTVGVSMNLTAKLTTFGRLVIMVLMFMGRVGPATVMLSLLRNRQEHNEVRYANADVLLG